MYLESFPGSCSSTNTGFSRQVYWFAKPGSTAFLSIDIDRPGEQALRKIFATAHWLGIDRHPQIALRTVPRIHSLTLRT
jgi:hypothetical protein